MGSDVFIILIVAMVSTVYTHVKIQQMHKLYVQFIVCQLYLNKAINNFFRGKAPRRHIV